MSHIDAVLPGWAPGDGWSAWMTALMAAARAGRQELLCAVIARRLSDGPDAGPGHGSPPLGRDEMSVGGIIKTAAEHLMLAAEDAPALRCLRDAALTLLWRYENDPVLFDRAGWLVVDCGVGRAPELAPTFAATLVGKLVLQYGHQLAELPRRADAHAADLFELWLSTVAPDLADDEDSARGQRLPMLTPVLKAWDSLWAPDRNVLADDQRAQWLSLLFRALLRLAPRAAAARALPRLSALVAPGGEPETACGQNAWDLLLDCADIFDANPVWAARFGAGFNSLTCKHVLDVWRSLYVDDDWPDWLKEMAESQVISLASAPRRSRRTLDAPGAPLGIAM